MGSSPSLSAPLMSIWLLGTLSAAEAGGGLLWGLFAASRARRRRAKGGCGVSEAGGGGGAAGGGGGGLAVAEVWWRLREGCLTSSLSPQSQLGFAHGFRNIYAR